MSDGPVATIIREKLNAALSPQRLEIEDDSGRHAGHHHEGGMDAKPGGESHFNGVLKQELSGPIHALSIRALTPVEDSHSA